MRLLRPRVRVPPPWDALPAPGPHITPAMAKRLIRELLKCLANNPTGLAQNLAVHHGVDAWTARENKRSAK